MFLLAGRDHVKLRDHDGNLTTFPRFGMEEHAARSLVPLRQAQDDLDRYLVMGPGSFTNLRILSLTINTLITQAPLQGKQPPCIHQIDSVSRYQHRRAHTTLPHTLVCFIGQKKNLWTIDMEQRKLDDNKPPIHESATKIAITELPELSVPFLVADMDMELPIDANHRCQISYDGRIVTLSYQDHTRKKDLTDRPRSADHTHVMPHYLVQANIG